MKAIIVGDTHFDFADPRLMDPILEATQKLKPNVIVQMGDLYDLYSFGRYPRSLNLVTPLDELTSARAAAEAFWKALKKAAPKADCYQLLGNHDERIAKMVASKAPELEAVLNALDFHQLWRFPGVTTMQDSRQELYLDSEGNRVSEEDAWVMLHHGHRSGLGEHATFNLTNTVVGHTHRGGVVSKRYRNREIWELNVGYVAEQKAKPFQYTPQRKSESVPGFGIIDEFGPRFVGLLPGHASEAA